ncbi:MAG: ribulose-phosphate 3-epimerase [Planctomycetota bacterium]|nr:ribulose-phosphate 3-epimerase [Planctomycetota bacterium]MDI6787385.1 ribulose-phosphate 3-epimerase [Planctomycetota bacterium]
MSDNNSILKQVRVSVSILSADFSCLRKELKKYESADVDSIHLDIMDGHFVPNITFGPVVVKAIRSRTKLPLDAHLMIEEPERYIDVFIKAGADIITIHSECFGRLKKHCSGKGREQSSSCYPVPEADPPLADKFPKELKSLDVKAVLAVLRTIKQKGKKAGITFNPGSVLCLDNRLLDEVDEVLIMSVNPGFAGQEFHREVLPKIKALRRVFKGDIKVDGGINEKTAPDAVKAGANILVTASYFFNAPDPKKAVEGLKNSHRLFIKER